MLENPTSGPSFHDSSRVKNALNAAPPLMYACKQKEVESDSKEKKDKERRKGAIQHLNSDG